MRAWAGLVVAVVGCSPTSDSAADSGQFVGFFVTSRGSGNGGNLGGLEGADARCATLAEEAGLPARTWRAFLSATGPIHARDRIGEGPWRNVEGVEVAPDVDSLIERGIASEHMLDEYGEPASKSPAPGLEHDILTGSDEFGMLWRTEATCADWTSNDPGDRVRVGHHDWGDLPDGEWIQSWTSVHSSGCDIETMARQLGTARTYCFAAD